MNFSVKKVDVINLSADDLAGIRTFYEDVLGLPLAFQDDTIAVFQLENVIISVRPATATAALIAPARVATPEAGSRFALAVFVDDVDAVCAELAERGVVLLNGPADQPWGMRTASFADPAGHIWNLGQDLDAS
jgi:lactoylglutathione lyase